MFIASLFITAQNCKQPECPSVNKWIMVQPYMKYYITIQRREL